MNKPNGSRLTLVRWLRPARNQPAGHQQYFDERYTEAIKRWVADGWCEVVDDDTPQPVVPRTVEVAVAPATREIVKRRGRRSRRE